MLALPLASEGASAQGWQTTFRSDGDNWTRTTRWVNPEFGGIQQLGRTAGGNNCPVSAFEVLNPRRGEIRCVGYVRPW